MTKRNMKKIVMVILSVVIVAGTAVSSVIPVFAEPGEESEGSIVVDEGEIVLDTTDSDMLQEELDSLEAELPDTSRQPYYGTARKSKLNSKGIINYANGTVVIDSSDFAYLADEIDMLESAYKANMVSALNTMRTFFLADGSISHEPDSERNSGEEAVRLSLDTIISGILQSQSVEHLAEQGIAGAIEDNISKGAAAWVNGELVIGNGADNDAYYKKGQEDVIANPDDYGIGNSLPNSTSVIEAYTHTGEGYNEKHYFHTNIKGKTLYKDIVIMPTIFNIEKSSGGGAVQISKINYNPANGDVVVEAYGLHVSGIVVRYR